MKLLSIAGLAVGTCLVSFAPLPALAQSSQANQSPTVTCRAALEGEGFADTLRTDAAQSCCYILKENEWYQQYNVVLNHFYKRDSGDVVLTLQCQNNVGGIGSDSSSASSGNDDGVSSVSSSSAEGAPPVESSSSASSSDESSSSASSSSDESTSSSAESSSSDQSSLPSSSDESSSQSSEPSSSSGELSSSASSGPPSDDDDGQGCDAGGHSHGHLDTLAAGQVTHPVSPEVPGHTKDCDDAASSEPSSSSEPPASSSSASSQEHGNPGNDKPVGNATETPNGDVSGFQPNPGTKGKSN